MNSKKREYVLIPDPAFLLSSPFLLSVFTLNPNSLLNPTRLWHYYPWEPCSLSYHPYYLSPTRYAHNVCKRHRTEAIPFHGGVKRGKLSTRQFLLSFNSASFTPVLCFSFLSFFLHVFCFFLFFIRILYDLTKTSSLSSSDTMTHSGFMALGVCCV